MPPDLRPERLELTAGPGPLLASLPAALGSPLSEYDLLLIGVAEPEQPGQPTRVILAELSPDENYGAIIWNAAEALADAGATSAVLIEHSGRFFAHPRDFPPSALAYASDACDNFGVEVRDALTIANRPEGRRWRSLSCTDPACCPPEGSAIPEPGATQP